MHYAIEVVIPPTEDVEGAVAQVMESTKDREPNSETGECSECSWWDYYEIGGRYTGRKTEAKLDKDTVDAFYAKLCDMGVTVSGLRWGKEELAPASQAEAVDALWREMFPGMGDKCVFFKHSGEFDDVCRVGDLPAALSCHRLVVAGPTFDSSRDKHALDSVEAEFLLATELWNGQTWQDTKFSGNVLEGIAEYRNQLERYSAEYAAMANPTDDWLCVTVDIHN